MKTDSSYKSLTLQHPFTTESGFTFEEPVVSYKSWGSLDENRSNVILICHALTGNPDADEWFHGFFGENGFLRPGRHFIICANVPGSCYGSTGPASPDPSTGKPYGESFPDLTIRDMVRFQQRFLDALEIEKIQLVIGGSMGGMQALEFAVMDPRVQSAVIIAAGKEHSPWAVGLNHVQRRAILADPSGGLSLARQIAMLSYRCPADFAGKFQADRFQAESYLDYQGEKLDGRFDARSYLCLSRAMDSHDVTRNRIGTAADILQEIKLPALVIGIDTDLLYPVEEQHELARLLPGARYREVRSTHGHDAFLIEFDQMNSIIRSFLTEIPTGNHLYHSEYV